MCIIIYSPRGEIPQAHLQNGLIRNPDGWGFAYPTKRFELMVHRGMGRKSFWKVWKKRRKGAPILFHARWASQGEKALRNCHPFFLKKHSMLVVHNGTMKLDIPAKDKGLSDTHIFCRDVLEKMEQGFLGNKKSMSFIDKNLGDGKMAFMGCGGRVVIVNEELGHWFEGRWYSNESYRPAVVVAQDIPESDDVDRYEYDDELPLWYQL